MKKKTLAKAAGIALTVLASQVSADIEVSYTHVSDTKKNRSIEACIDAIRDHHPAGARLMLRHQAQYRMVNGQRFLKVRGWVWKNGQRVQVTHECSNVGTQVVALNVIFQNEQQLAAK